MYFWRFNYIITINIYSVIHRRLWLALTLTRANDSSFYLAPHLCLLGCFVLRIHACALNKLSHSAEFPLSK